MKKATKKPRTRKKTKLTSASRSKAPQDTGEPSKTVEVRIQNVSAPTKELRERFRESHRHILDEIILAESPNKEIDISKHISVSKVALGDYVTLDWQHYEDIKDTIQVIRTYTKDPTRRRPLNIIMQADPGSGKSHFIRSLSRRIAQDGVKAVTFNMSSLRKIEDFIQPLEEVRNIKVTDRIPLLFLDEFDSDQNNYSLLLPLLWDGELSVGQRRLRIGKVVTILAGSDHAIGEAMKSAKGLQPSPDTEAGKLPDLLSRINGGELSIPGLDETAHQRDRRVDKVCLTIALLNQRFPSLTIVPWALLRFVADTRFRYGVRSISHLIDLIPSKDEKKQVLEVDDLQFPLKDVGTLKSNSLAFHLVAEDGPAAVINMWKSLASNSTSVRFKSDSPVSITEILQSFFDGRV